MLSSTNKTFIFPHEKQRVVNKTCYIKPIHVVQQKIMVVFCYTTMLFKKQGLSNPLSLSLCLYGHSQAASSASPRFQHREHHKLLTWEEAEKCQSKDHRGTFYFHGEGGGSCLPTLTLLGHCSMKPKERAQGWSHIYRWPGSPPSLWHNLPKNHH